MTVKWDASKADAMVRAAASRGVRKGTEIVRREVVRKIVEDPKTGAVYTTRFFTNAAGKAVPIGERPPHQASAPGEAPASDSGRLVQSIVTSFDQTKIVGTVAATAAHAADLEMGNEKIAPRPYLRVSLDDKRQEVVGVIQAELDKVKDK